MVVRSRRLLVIACLLLINTNSFSSTAVKSQAQLAYLDLLLGHTSRAYQRIPKKTGSNKDQQSQQTLAFANQMRKYGQNKMAIAALELFLSDVVETKASNHYWLNYAEYFLELGSVASAEKCLSRLTKPVHKKIRARYHRVTADIALYKLNIDQVEHILSSKWKGRHSHKPYTRLNLATAYAYKGNFAAAHASVSQLSKDLPEEVNTEEREALVEAALTRIGFAYLAFGNLAKAKAFLSKVPIKSIYAQRATLGLAWAEIGQGQYAEALSPLIHLIDNTQDHQIEKQEAYSLLALVASKQKKYGKAISLYSQSKESYVQEINALKRDSIPIYSGKTIELLATRTIRENNDTDLSDIHEILGQKLHYYLHDLLEKSSTKVLINAYRQQSLLLQGLSDLSRTVKISNNDYWRYQQILKENILKHKGRLTQLFSAEIEGHIARLEDMISHNDFSTGLMYEKLGRSH